LIERAPNTADKREAFLSLSGRGQRVYRDLAPRALAFERALEAALDAHERALLDRLLRRTEARALELAGGTHAAAME
jgi:DNA-binding MarR family transcriptional regulator